MAQQHPRLIDDFHRPLPHKATTIELSRFSPQKRKSTQPISRTQLVSNYEQLKWAHRDFSNEKSNDAQSSESHAVSLTPTVAYDFLLLTILGYIATYTTFINWVILLYLVFVIIWRIKSQRIFGLALASLVLIPLLTIFHRNDLASSYAIIAFFMLCIGLVQAIIELKTQPE